MNKRGKSRAKRRQTRRRNRRLKGGSTDEEKLCTYVSSRGILKSCDVHSPNPISSNASIGDIDFSKGFDGCSVYVCGTAIPEFVKKIETIPYKFTLVSGDCDESVPEHVFPNQNDFKKFIESDKIIHWFSQNCVGQHPKLSGIPIGLDNHSVQSNSRDIGPKMSPLACEKQILDVKAKGKPLSERIVKAYCNFHFRIDFYGSPKRYGGDRQDAIDKVPKECTFYEPSVVPRQKSFENMIEYAFVISPHGNGYDCHRTWEALVLGCIPIVKTSPIDHIFADLPVLIVKDWSEVTLNLLQKTIQEYKSEKYNFEKLKLSYWTNLIKEKK